MPIHGYPTPNVPDERPQVSPGRREPLRRMSLPAPHSPTTSRDRTHQQPGDQLPNRDPARRLPPPGPARNSGPSGGLSRRRLAVELT
jgi:hypothetical protein